MVEKMTSAEYRALTQQPKPVFRAGTEAAGEEISETPLSSQIRQMLDLLGLENDRIQSGKLFITTEYQPRKKGIAYGEKKKHSRWIYLSKTGTPDRWCIIHKRLVFIEVKTKGKKPTKEQLQRQAELKAAGAIIINTDSFDHCEAAVRALMIMLDPYHITDQKRLALIAFANKVRDGVDVDQAAVNLIKEFYG